MENEKEMILSNLLFYESHDLEFKPNKIEYNGPFSNQKSFGQSIKKDPLGKKKFELLKNQGFTKKKFQELAKTNPKKYRELCFELQVELEIYQLQQPSSNVEYFQRLKKFYVEIVKQVRDNILKSESKSRKSKLCKFFYQFSDLQAPNPKILKLKTKSGEIKATEFPKKYYMMKTDNFFDKSEEKWIKKSLILLKKTKVQRKDIIIEKSWKVNMEYLDLKIKNEWNDFLVEREKFEKNENSCLGNDFLLQLLHVYNTSETSNKGSIKVVKVWDIVLDSVLRCWVLFMQKEFYQKIKEEALQNEQTVRGFVSYKKTVSVRNLSKELKNQVDLLCQDESQCKNESEYIDFNTYLELSLDEVVSIKQENIKKYGKLAALRERIYLVSEPLLTALIRSKLLIFESRENNKNFEQGAFLTLEEVKNSKYNTLLLNLNTNELNKSFFQGNLF